MADSYCKDEDNRWEIFRTRDGIEMQIENCHLDIASTAEVIALLKKNRSVINNLMINMCTGHIDKILTVALAICTELKSLTVWTKSTRSADFEPIAVALGVGLRSNGRICSLDLAGGCYEDVIVEHFSLSSDAARSLRQGLSGNTSLRKLEIGQCRFENPEALEIFCNTLESMPLLEKIEFRDFFEPGGQVLEDQSIARLVRALQHCSKLKKLSIAGMKCLKKGTIEVAALLKSLPISKLAITEQLMARNEFTSTLPYLARGLEKAVSSVSLNLAYNNIETDYDMTNLTDVLLGTSVKSLDLSHCDIQSSAMNILSSRLSSLQFMESLRIRRDAGDPWDDQAYKNLANAMKSNYRIQKLDVDKSPRPRSAHHWKMIQYYTNLNRAGRRYIEYYNRDAETARRITPISRSLWPLVLSRINSVEYARARQTEQQANLIFYCLQKGSVIFPTC